MKKLSLLFILSLLILTPAHAADPKTLFQKQADLFVSQEGPSRLVLPFEVLSECEPDLSDLRIFNFEGKEVPYLVHRPEVPNDSDSTVQREEAKILNVDQQETHPEEGPPLFREKYEIEIPSAPPSSGSWGLVFESSESNFVRNVKIEKVDEQGQKQGIEAKTSIFRLPDYKTEKTRLDLPASISGKLLVTLEGEAGYLEPRLHFESSKHSSKNQVSTLQISLQVLSQKEVGDRTVLELARPKGLVPDQLKLNTSTPLFHRSVEVKEVHPTQGETILGSATLFRMKKIASIEKNEISLNPAHWDRLKIEIENGDSPPLENLVVQATLKSPTLIFSVATADSSKPAGVLRFGGGLTQPPHYDLSDLHFASSDAADEISKLPVARLGGVALNPLFRNGSPLQFAMTAGASLDSGLYTHRRSLEVTGDGLSRVVLQPEDLLILQSDFSDLRISDSQSRQWPYLLERAGIQKVISLKLEKLGSQKGTSHYRMTLPLSPLTLREITLRTDAPFFDRSYRLTTTRVAQNGESEEVVLAQGSLHRSVGDESPLRLAFYSVPFTSAKLTIEDGNNAPLVLGEASTTIPLPILYFAAPAGHYSLLLGNPKDGFPNYEINQIKDILLSNPPVDAKVGSLEPNPDHGKVTKTSVQKTAQESKQQFLLWGVLVAAVLGLVILSLKTARSEPVKKGE